MTKTKLPIVGSSAATTAFCQARVDGPDDVHLYLDGNGKITRDNGTLLAPGPNAFSLPAAAVSGLEHCPQSTEACRAACYVGPLEKAQRATYDLYEHNARMIRTILADEHMANDWAMRFAHAVTTISPGGFRWHVSGDVYSMEYARWIADVCRESPTVDHWIYTRSFDFLEPLIEVSTLRGGNLSINLSCDKDNYEAAKITRDKWREGTGDILNDLDEHGGIIDRPDPWRWPRLAYLTLDGSVPDDLGDDDVIFPDYQIRPRQFATLAESPWWTTLTAAQRKMVCPVDAHGKSEKNRCGPCDRCLT